MVFLNLDVEPRALLQIYVDDVFMGTLERDPAAVTTPAESAVVRPSAPSGPMTMYKIQGCYLGNVLPKASDLRPGCDLARLITFTP